MCEELERLVTIYFTSSEDTFKKEFLEVAKQVRSKQKKEQKQREHLKFKGDSLLR